MSDNSTSTFRTVMRGYEPAEVDRYIAQLTTAVQSANQRVEELGSQVEKLSSDAEQARNKPVAVAKPAPPIKASFAEFGERVGRILALAEEEADEIRTAAVAETRRRIAELDSTTAASRTESERYADEVRTGAEQEAARIVEDAKRAADQLLDDADRQALARRREAEAVYEEQRAKAAKAAADFEQTLADRRDKAEAAFEERAEISEKELQAARNRVAKLRAEGDQLQAEAARRAQQLQADAERKAEQIVADAMERADRIRAESDRELAAATQRRDAINAQLTNVRQMLATLSGASGNQLPDEEPAEANTK
jgi:DivIVA domain-containing protein